MCSWKSAHTFVLPKVSGQLLLLLVSFQCSVSFLRKFSRVPLFLPGNLLQEKVKDESYNCDWFTIDFFTVWLWYEPLLNVLLKFRVCNTFGQRYQDLRSCSSQNLANIYSLPWICSYFAMFTLTNMKTLENAPVYKYCKSFGETQPQEFLIKDQHCWKPLSVLICRRENFRLRLRLVCITWLATFMRDSAIEKVSFLAIERFIVPSSPAMIYIFLMFNITCCKKLYLIN